jgi:hypothetical protein
MPISKLNVQKYEASQIQQLCEGLTKVVGDDTISFLKVYEACLKEIYSGLSYGVTFACLAAH